MKDLRIAFIGLGNMGAPIAMNLIEVGFEVTLYNRTEAKADPFKSLRAVLTRSPKQAVENADVLITMVSDDEALNSISEEVLPSMKAGSIHLSMSTVSPSIVKRLLPLHEKHQVNYVAAPVMGRPPAAEARMLFILLSGDNASKAKLKPVLEAIGQRNFDFGEDPTAAHAAKLALNLMVLTNIELLSEVMLFAEKQGLDKKVLFESITNTQLNSPVLRIYGDLILKEQDNPTGFSTKLAYKDIKIANETAQNAGVELPLAKLISSHFENTVAAGNGEKDVSLLIKFLRDKLSKNVNSSGQ